MKKTPKRPGPQKITKRLLEKPKPKIALGLQRRRPVTLDASAEMAFLEENAEEFARYAGHWLLLVDAKLVAHSGDYLEIANEIARRGLKDGLVYYVPKPEESDFVLV